MVVEKCRAERGALELTTAEELLSAARSYPIVRLNERLGKGGLIVVAPHPDDESLACGGIIAQACSERRPTRVIVVSDGTGSHPASKTHPAERLRQLREEEARQAVHELGLDPGNVIFLRLPDRFVPCEGPRAAEAIDIIEKCVMEVRAEALFVSWRHDPHCDHQSSYRLARKAARALGVKLYEYTVWGCALPAETPVANKHQGFRISIGPALSKKRRAIAAHRSQTTPLIQDDPSGFRLTSADLARFDDPFEIFFWGEE